MYPCNFPCDDCAGHGRLRTDADPRNEDPSVECEACGGEGELAHCNDCGDIIDGDELLCASCAGEAERDDTRRHENDHSPGRL